MTSVFLVFCSQTELPNMVAVADADFTQTDAVFCCLPHGTTQVRANHVRSTAAEPGFLSNPLFDLKLNLLLLANL